MGIGCTRVGVWRGGPAQAPNPGMLVEQDSSLTLLQLVLLSMHCAGRGLGQACCSGGRWAGAWWHLQLPLCQQATAVQHGGIHTVLCCGWYGGWQRLFYAGCVMERCCKSMLLHMEGVDVQLHSLGCMTVLWPQRS